MPFELPIPLYQNTRLQNKISEKCKECRVKAKSQLTQLIEKMNIDTVNATPNTIGRLRGLIRDALENKIQEIDDLVCDTITKKHVAPVGFEVDRIVLPAVRMKADRVWLITNRPEVAEGRKFVKSIQNELKHAGCSQMEADRIDLFDILRALRLIVLKEKGNSILVNESVGSKIQAMLR